MMWLHHLPLTCDAGIKFSLDSCMLFILFAKDTVLPGKQVGERAHFIILHSLPLVDEGFLQLFLRLKDAKVRASGQ